MKCGLVKHRLPCFGYIVQETDKGGELLNSVCIEKSVSVIHFPVLKVIFSSYTEACRTSTIFNYFDCKSFFASHYSSQMGKDVTLADGSIVRAADVTGPPVKGRKLVYVGDTGDASNISEAAKDCDLLVHDATGLDPRRGVGTKRVRHRLSCAHMFVLYCSQI